MPTAVKVTATLKRQVVQYIKANGYITNRRCRDALGLSYDQCITLFNHMVGTGELIRTGEASGTKYILPQKATKHSRT